jgi:hypothetical protein
MTKRAPRRPRLTRAPKRPLPSSVPLVASIAPSAAQPLPPSPSGAGPRFPITGLEASFLWLVVVLAWIFAGPRGGGPFALWAACTVCGLTLASLITIGRRWPFAGYLMLCFVAGLFGGRRGGRRW